MVDSHLSNISLRSLRLGDREVSSQIVEGSTDGLEFTTEAVPHELGSSRRPAPVIVQKHERDVVPVLGLAPR